MTIKLDEYGLAVQAARPVSSQTIVFTATNSVSTTFAAGPTSVYDQQGRPVRTPNNTQHVRCVATSGCWIAFGNAPVAAIGVSPAIYLPAGVPEYFWVGPGDRIAVVQDSAGGSLNIAELTQ